MSPTSVPEAGHTAALLVAAMAERGLTVAVAESLTGGLVMAELTAIPGASAVLRGGPVVYATDTKASALDVDPALLAARGPVDPLVAEAMAVSVRQRWGSDIGLATTGVAGPGGQSGRPVGEVYVGVCDEAGSVVLSLDLASSGDRGAIRRRAVDLALTAVLERLGLARESSVGGRGYTGSVPSDGGTTTSPDRREAR